MNNKAFSDYCTQILKDSSVYSNTVIFHDLLFKTELKELLNLVSEYMVNELSETERRQFLEKAFEEMTKNFTKQFSKIAEEYFKRKSPLEGEFRA
jgi:hypothetical protein